MTCENCRYRITYQELPDEFEFDPNGEMFHVCMLTDAEVKLTDNCEDYTRRPRQLFESIEEWEELK